MTFLYPFKIPTAVLLDGAGGKVRSHRKLTQSWTPWYSQRKTKKPLMSEDRQALCSSCQDWVLLSISKTWNLEFILLWESKLASFLPVWFTSSCGTFHLQLRRTSEVHCLAITMAKPLYTAWGYSRAAWGFSTCLSLILWYIHRSFTSSWPWSSNLFTICSADHL